MNVYKTSQERLVFVGIIYELKELKRYTKVCDGDIVLKILFQSNPVSKNLLS